VCELDLKGALSLDVTHSKWNSSRRFRRVNIVTFWDYIVKGISDFKARCGKPFYIGILPWLTCTCLSVLDKDFCFRSEVANRNCTIYGRPGFEQKKTELYWTTIWMPRRILTFKNRASYIHRTGVPLPSICCILYIYIYFNKYKYWVF